MKEVLKRGGGMPKGQPGQRGGAPHGQSWNNLNQKMISFRLYLIDQNKYPSNKQKMVGKGQILLTEEF